MIYSEGGFFRSLSKKNQTPRRHDPRVLLYSDPRRGNIESHDILKLGRDPATDRSL